MRPSAAEGRRVAARQSQHSKEVEIKNIGMLLGGDGNSFLGKKLPKLGAMLKSFTVYRFCQVSAHDWTSSCPMKTQKQRQGVRLARLHCGRNDVTHRVSRCANGRPHAFSSIDDEWMNLPLPMCRRSRLLRPPPVRPFLFTN